MQCKFDRLSWFKQIDCIHYQFPKQMPDQTAHCPPRLLPPKKAQRKVPMEKTIHRLKVGEMGSQTGVHQSQQPIPQLLTNQPPATVPSLPPAQ
ncbi:hypothetical protein EG68_10785 [Paragonimus skrjabini miyazakii]|uniref:Uncharacterized protein n=1 Tax=Paragonimus skrjabini miyazakii TaxID=59628 RepID=A0A8S9YHQ6_9TREM|nr:hypothetical protein EG68_10785 [Paragonimus skrjabini miyazakii]